MNPFTLVGATTRSGLLTLQCAPRFGIQSRLQYYNTELLTTIVQTKFIDFKDANYKAAIEIAGRVEEHLVLLMPYYVV